MPDIKLHVDGEAKMSKRDYNLNKQIKHKSVKI